MKVCASALVRHRDVNVRFAEDAILRFPSADVPGAESNTLHGVVALPSGETALMTAVRTGVTAAVDLLLDRGAEIDTRDREFEQTALMLAVREAHPEVVALLLDRGADVDARTRVGPTPKFVPPCKGTGCGSEGVGINRGGLPDRGRRAASFLRRTSPGGTTPPERCRST